MVSATRSGNCPSTAGFLGALLLCGVCDQTMDFNLALFVSRSSSALWCLRPPSAQLTLKVWFLGALLLCGVCDIKAYDKSGLAVSRSSSALWCLRPITHPWRGQHRF